MPAAVVAAIIAGGASVGAAAIASKGARSAANAQVQGASHAADVSAQASTHATDVQAKANEEALAFQKQQAEASYQSAEAARRANYDQWAAAQRRLGAVGDLVGLSPREIPGYVPQPDPMLYTPKPVQGGPVSAQAGPGASAAGGPNPYSGLTAQQIIEGYQQSNPYSSSSMNDIVGRLNQAGIPATVARHGVNGSLASADKVVLPGGQIIDLVNDVGGANKWQYAVEGPPTAGPMGPAPSSTPQAGAVGSVASYLMPTAPMPFQNTVPLTPSLAMPSPYARVRNVGDYLR